MQNRDIPARRPTLERQSSIEKLPTTAADPAAADEFPRNMKLEVVQSTPTHSHLSFSSHKTFANATQSVSEDDNVFGLPKTSQFNSLDSQENFSQSSISDQSTSFTGLVPMSKAGRKRKHPLKPGKYICRYCGRACAKPSVLEKHIRMHTGERPYPCNVCDLSFKTNSNLYKHKKSAAHTHKCQERGLSLESSRDESMDTVDADPVGDDDSNHPSYASHSSFDGHQANSRTLSGERIVSSFDISSPALSITTQSERPSETSYMETTRHLEVVYDTVDSYAEKMGMMVWRRAHWLLDGDCIVSIQLQSKVQSLATTAGNEILKKEKDELLEDSLVKTEVSPPAEGGEADEENLDTNGGLLKSRLSRQSSVTTTSPAANMFISEVPSTVEQLESPERIGREATDSLADSLIASAPLVDGEELLKHIRKIISSDTNIHSNIKLLLHKHCMEMKLRLAIPDVSQRRAQNPYFSQSYESIDDNATENVAALAMPGSSAKSFMCTQCATRFSRRHILDIHSAFYCTSDIPAAAKSSSSSSKRPLTAHSFDELSISDERKRMKLLKSGTEDSSFTYLIADEHRYPQKYARSKSDMPLTDKLLLLRQSPQSSAETNSNDGVTAKQQLKNHVLKHMSHGSLGSDAGGGQRSLAGSMDIPALDKMKPFTVVKQGDSVSSLSSGSPTSAALLADGRVTPKISVVAPSSGGSISIHPSNCGTNTVYKGVEEVAQPSLSDNYGKVVLNPYSSANAAVSHNYSGDLLKSNQSMIIPVIVGGGLTVPGTPQNAYKMPPSGSDILPTGLVHDLTLPANTRRDITRSIVEHSVVSNSPSYLSQPQPKHLHVPGGSKSFVVNLSGKPDFPSPIVSQGLKPGPSIFVDSYADTAVRPIVVSSPVTSAVTVAVQRYIDPAFGSLTVNSNPQSLPYLRSPLLSTRVTPSKISPLALSPSSIVSTPTEKRLEKNLLPSTIPGISDLPVCHGSQTELIRKTSRADGQNLKVQIVLPAITAASAKGDINLVESDRRKLVSCMSPGVRLREHALASGVQFVSVSPRNRKLSTPPHNQPPDHQRLSLMRRRFSQSRSQSSVSFDDSVSISQAPAADCQSHSQVATSSVAILSTPSKGILRVTDTKPIVVSSTERAASARASLPNPTRTPISTIISVSSNHPITYQLFLSQQTQITSSEYFNHRPDVLLTRKACTECHLTSQTVLDRVPSHSVLGARQSNYSGWVPNKAPLRPSPWIDMSVPMCCYKYKRHYSEDQYASSAMDSRNILTHSSYWQYKNKLRVMQPMPSQMSITQLTSSVSIRASSTADVVKTEQKKVSSTSPMPQRSSASLMDIPTAVAALAKSDDDKVTIVNNNNRPSVITRDFQHKKILHRSQSTPNAGGDNQSKLIAGGFKSDEDYVYIRGRGKGKYVCQQCGIRCRKPSMLKKHIRTHTDLRPYSCKHCNFSFKTKGNLTKHMRSKAHHRRCLELNIVPVPSTVDDSQIDKDILASQQKLSRESKIKGAKASLASDDRDAAGMSDASDDELSEDEDDENTSDDNSSVDDALHIDEDIDEQAESTAGDLSPTLPPSSASLRRVHSMPAHHMANSFDASALADILPAEPTPTPPVPSIVSEAPPPLKKRKKNHLNLTITTSHTDSTSKSGGSGEERSSTNIEDDIARSLLDLSQTPVHGTPTLKPQFRPSHNLAKIDSLIGALRASTPGLYSSTESVQTPVSPAVSANDVKRVSVVRSTKPPVPIAAISSRKPPVTNDNEEPIDLRVQSKPAEPKFICPLCRAICNTQSNLDSHLKLHDGPVIEVDNRSTRRLLSQSQSFGSFDKDTGGSGSIRQSTDKVQTPQTPNLLRRQHAVSMLDGDAEDEELDHQIKVEPGEKLSDRVRRRKCPYCPKIFLTENSLPHHVKSQHLITQEYVCTYKDCGKKFTNMQDLTYHLGTHALDDNDKYQPISVPKCGLCEKTFKSISSLKQHIQHHSETRTHVCEYCDAGFTTAQSLKHHLKTHTQERPYVCGECGSTFARSDHLTQHSKTHKKNALAETPMQNRSSLDQPTILNPAGNSASTQHQLLR